MSSFAKSGELWMLQKTGSIPFPDSPSRRLPGASRTGASFIGGWRLLITRQLSPEQSGTTSTRWDRRTETRASPRKRGSSTLAPAQRAPLG